VIKAEVTNTKRMSYGLYKLTLTYGTDCYRAHAKYKDPCKERKTKTLDKGEEILKSFDIYVKPNVYADLVNKRSLTLEFVLGRLDETEEDKGESL